MSSTSTSSSNIKGSWRNVQVETNHLQPAMYLSSMKGNLEDIGEYEAVEDTVDGDHLVAIQLIVRDMHNKIK